MKIFESSGALRTALAAERCSGRSIGFVPTMGYLHEGHVSLISRATRDNDAVVVSIFVNPLQFGPSEDLGRYPRDLERDLEMCEAAGTGFVFTPAVDEMYPGGETLVTVSSGRLGRIVEGEHRPGHFDGVATVLSKLFSIVGECRAYFGQKDAQQLAVIRRLVSDLSLPVDVIGCPTVREPDGLALSSRNTYLSPSERSGARILSEALFEASSAIRSGERSADIVRKMVSEMVEGEPLIDLQYVEVVDADSFEPVSEIVSDVVVALAAFAGETRLIDNVYIDRDPQGPDQEVEP